MNQTLTVLIPCKNEADNLAGCVASAIEIADEILVADSGSSDGTIELAERLQCRVIQREYVNSGDFKNWAIPQARHSWVLVLDADERLTPELSQEIAALLRQGPAHDAYTVGRRNFLLGHAVDHGDWSRDRVTRLLKRGFCRYDANTDHSEVRLPTRRVGSLQHKIIHFTAWDLQEYINKLNHYAAQQADYWHSLGKRPTMLHLMFNAPLRFLRGYVLRGGFRDGAIGFHVASLTAYYSFLKQLFLWQRWHGRCQEQVDGDHAADLSGAASTSDASHAGNRAAA